MKRKRPLSQRQKTARRRKRRRILGISLLVLVLAGAALFAAYLRTLPDIRSYDYESATHSVVYSADGQWLGSIERKNSTYVGRDDIPDRLINAVVAIEDKRFFQHPGVDPISILRAFIHNMQEGEIVEGGSSITQQLARLLFFGDEVSLSRKIAEALTALRLEMRYSKDEIITMYLNEVYLGGGAYGVYEASMLYFGKPPAELTNAECAMLAGIITAPSAYCPLDAEGYRYASERKGRVLSALYETGKISREEFERAVTERIVIYGKIPGQTAFEFGSCADGCRSCLGRIYQEAVGLLSEHYRAAGMNAQAARQKAENDLFSQTVKIYSTINYSMQSTVLDSVYVQVTARNAGASCAFVSIDSATGNVLCYYGSDGTTLLDLAQSPHQPGSTIKPLYMLYLVDRGIATTDDIVVDEPVDIDGYAPGNFAGEYYGYVTMRETLTESLNCASLKFFTMTDISDEIDFVRSMGVSTIVSEDYSLAFSLGGFTYGITPAELAGAYCVFANGGSAVTPRFVTSIELPDGTVIKPEETLPRRIASQEAAQEIKSCLYSVVTRGTATPALTGLATFGKTGTTDDAKDVWFVGGTGSTVTAIWVGTPDGTVLPGLGSYCCSYCYSDWITRCRDKGVFVSEGLQETFYDSTENIFILRDGADPSDGITDDETVSVKVLSDRVDRYRARRVVRVVLDSSTGLLFSDSCPAVYRQERWMLQTEAPDVYCTSTHMPDWRSLVDLFMP